jgi:hypothetical protein
VAGHDVHADSGTQPFTAECWFKRSRIGQTEAVFVQWCDGLTLADCNWAIVLDGPTNTLNLWWQNTTQTFNAIAAGVVTDTTTFHHAMAVFDGSVMRLFLDGTLVATLRRHDAPAVPEHDPARCELLVEPDRLEPVPRLRR